MYYSFNWNMGEIDLLLETFLKSRISKIGLAAVISFQRLNIRRKIRFVYHYFRIKLLKLGLITNDILLTTFHNPLNIHQKRSRCSFPWTRSLRSNMANKVSWINLLTGSPSPSFCNYFTRFIECVGKSWES